MTVVFVEVSHPYFGKNKKHLFLFNLPYYISFKILSTVLINLLIYICFYINIFNKNKLYI